jgi:addiction module HigA family antidote
MKPLGVRQNRLARDLDVPLARVNEIVKGRRAVTTDTALRLGKCSGTTAEFWLGLQLEHDVRRPRRKTWSAIKARVRRLASSSEEL